jgi:peptide-methionine (S)-S-oxide reductase
MMQRRSYRVLVSFAVSMITLTALRPSATEQPPPEPSPTNSAAPAPTGGATARAIFAGGCFWCMEAPFEKLDGVQSATSGYIGGELDHPTYEQVSSGRTGHAEAVEVLYDPTRVTYEKLLDVFWHQIDPTTPNAQFCDHGSQYRSGIFYLTLEQKKAAEVSKEALSKSGRLSKPIVTEISAAGRFWPAEEYHQDYYKNNPIRYRYYRAGCGRDETLLKIWGAGAEH